MPERITGALREALATVYGLRDAALDRVHNGQSTVNFAGTAGRRRIFVKCYSHGTDLDAERQAIALSEYAGAAGIPTARVIASRDGELIHHAGGHAFSVWNYMDGESADRVPLLTPDRMAAAGHAVGNLHRVLASHPAAVPTLAPSTAVCSLETAVDNITALLDRYRAVPEPGEFDSWAVEALRCKLSLVPRLTRLLAALPPLSSQIVHGDLAAPNLLKTLHLWITNSEGTLSNEAATCWTCGGHGMLSAPRPFRIDSPSTSSWRRQNHGPDQRHLA